MPLPPANAPVIAVGAVIWKDDRLLLIRRGRPPRQGSWSLPGGRQELGETVYQTAEREVREETGLAIRILDVAAVIDLIERDGDQVAFHYTIIDVVAEWVAGEAVAGDDAAEVAWVLPADLPAYKTTEAVREVVGVAALKRDRRIGPAADIPVFR